MVTQSGAWSIEYLDPTTEILTPLKAEFDQLPDELNGDSNASFYLPNTDANRALVGRGDVLVNIYFNEELQYSGILTTAELSSTKIKAIILDAVVLMLDEAEPITGVYDSVPANQILTEVLAATPGTNLLIGACPTNAISVVFYKANRLDIVKFLAEATASEYWTSDGTTINLGTRGGNYWACPERLIINTRNIDASKVADKVIIRGVDTFGRHITGEAGSSGWIGARVRVFNEDTPADQATLANLAIKKLTELQSGTATGSPVATLITMGYQFGVGDYIYINRPKYLFNGQNYRIVQLTKSKLQASFQLDKPKQTVEKTLAELRNWEKNGIYLPGCTSWSINLQNLVGFYHLTEGTGTVAKDSAPIDAPNNGTIVNGHWDPSPIGGGAKVLALQGDGYVDCNTAIDLSVNGSCFSVGGWFSPVNLDNIVRHLAHKDGQFGLSYVNTVLRFTFTDSNGDVNTCDSNTGKIKAYGRHFVMITYDGETLTMYLGGIVHKTWNLNIGIHESTNKIYLGMFLWGNAAELMFWTRCLTAQEVLELNFFPLNRVVTKISPPDGFYLTYGPSVKEKNTVTLDYLLSSLILNGEAVVSSATGTMNSYEAGYTVLALLQYGGASKYSLCQTILDLWATLQNADGSWYQQYNPYSPYAVVAQTSSGTDGDLKVDSGAALLSWAMSRYDELTSGTRYKTKVQLAMGFLRNLQYAHTVAHGSNLISNIILDGVTDTTALLADCAECILSAKHAMDAYGNTLVTSASYSVKTFANDLYYSICVIGWRGSTALYFDTSYPYEQNTNIPFNYKEKISYTQALCSWAIYEFAKSAYLTASDYTAGICEPCLDYIITVTRGSWGGEFFCPFTGAEDESQDEFAGYSGLMCIAAQKVNSSKYSELIVGLQDFIKWLTLPDGRICDVADVKGKLWRSKLSSNSEGGFLVLPIAIALLSGAGN